MNWTPNSVILAGTVALITVSGMELIPGKLDDQIIQLVETLIPWTPLFIIIYLGAAVWLEGIVSGITGFFKALWNGVRNVFWVLLFITFFFPLAMADTFVFGPIAQQLWLHHGAVIGMLIATSFVFYLLGEVSQNFWLLYYGFMVLCWGFAVIWSAIAPSVYDTETVIYRVKGDGAVYAVPTRTIYIQRSEEKTNIEFTANGRVADENKYYPPFGDPENRIPDPYGGWYIPQGQITFLVYKTRNVLPLAVPTQPEQEGVVKLAGIDVGEQVGGYYFSGKVEVPAGVSGWVMPMFEGITPNRGVVKVTFYISPEKSVPGRVLALPWYRTSVLLVLGTVVLLLAPLLAKRFLGLSGGLTVLVYIVALLVGGLTVFALTQVEPTMKNGLTYVKEKIKTTVAPSPKPTTAPAAPPPQIVRATNPDDPKIIRTNLRRGSKVVEILVAPISYGITSKTPIMPFPVCDYKYTLVPPHTGTLYWHKKLGGGGWQKVGTTNLADQKWRNKLPGPVEKVYPGVSAVQIETNYPRGVVFKIWCD